MKASMENRTVSAEQIAHDLTLRVVTASIKGFQRGNDYQVSDVDMARFAFSVYDECFPVLRGLAEE